MAKQKVKKKKRNVAGRKHAAFAETVRIIAKDTLSTLEELTAHKKPEDELVHDEKKRLQLESAELPDGVTVVEGLHGHWIFNDERLMRHMDVVEKILQEFESTFWDEKGASILDLRRDRKNRVWADDETILLLVYVSIAMGHARWSYSRDEWKNLMSGQPFIEFLCNKRGEENVITEQRAESAETTVSH